jgi:hypothetical protein
MTDILGVTSSGSFRQQKTYYVTGESEINALSKKLGVRASRYFGTVSHVQFSSALVVSRSLKPLVHCSQKPGQENSSVLTLISCSTKAPASLAAPFWRYGLLA